MASPVAPADGAQVITSTVGQRNLPWWFSASLALLQGIRAGRIDIGLPDGRVFRIEGVSPGQAAHIDVREPGLFARVAREGELGFCEAYLDGWWDTLDLETLLDVLLTSDTWVDRSHPGAGLVKAYQRFARWLNRNTKTQARLELSAFEFGRYVLGRSVEHLDSS